MTQFRFDYYKLLSFFPNVLLTVFGLLISTQVFDLSAIDFLYNQSTFMCTDSLKDKMSRLNPLDQLCSYTFSTLEPVSQNQISSI